ncbi:MAG: SGNH/GDSL hydrolase family protein [Pirellulales bacterium]|nr:SGNH/GDSL hydrolase family protein [Pirellulales bacterium]
MKHIMQFGDSNTWGYAPGSDGDRLPRETRICGAMQAELGGGFRVIEEGLNGRTTVFDDPMFDNRCGKSHLPMLLESHAPLDLVSIMLGTNDLKHFFHLSVVDIALGASTLVEIVQESDTGPNGEAPRVLLVSPPLVTDPDAFAPQFAGAREKSSEFRQHYSDMAAQLGCGFFDAATVTEVPTPDGVHLDAASAARLGRALADKIRTMLV